ncbi:MAG: hypothetical protein WDA70_08470 [Lysobacteraceae bacterium]
MQLDAETTELAFHLQATIATAQFQIAQHHAHLVGWCGALPDVQYRLIGAMGIQRGATGWRLPCIAAVETALQCQALAVQGVGVALVAGAAGDSDGVAWSRSIDRILQAEKVAIDLFADGMHREHGLWCRPGIMRGSCLACRYNENCRQQQPTAATPGRKDGLMHV